MEIDNLLPVQTREELRAWLQAFSRKEKACWVIVSMTPKPDTLLYLDTAEEALCFGWIDGIKKKIGETGVAQRLSPRSPKSSWTELNKERVRRLEKLGLMTDAGRAVLPGMGQDSFRIDQEIMRRIQEDPLVCEHFRAFPELYQRIRIDNIQSCRQQPELYQSRLDKFIAGTKANKSYGQWHDNGRLLDY
ncbi:YdeI/OmpD-associated family protein [Paenibacillus sp. MMS20-IR301]|uniref:YdeI/OmpD-associated family protein n=1 Tax=Paenibacillus sp. MMS20-IR301 TaxID=2895946 RepID=UPI0028E9FC87|nr:YdeI/OmpD-associated family protein [Paenibacillus sp. MMS20-IR301]WNS45282.1 YdeI/OmpD-associated family protein [Paenibacillus sp. MMS20-IR301]